MPTIEIFEAILAGVAWEALALGWDVRRDENGHLLLEPENGEVCLCRVVGHGPAPSNASLGLGDREPGFVVTAAVPVVDRVEPTRELLEEVHLWDISRKYPAGCLRVIPVSTPGEEANLARVDIEYRLAGTGFRPEEVVAAARDMTAEVEDLHETLVAQFGAEPVELDFTADFDVPLTLNEDADEGELVAEPVGRACQLELFGAAGRQQDSPGAVPRPYRSLYFWAHAQGRRLGISKPTPLLLARACAQRNQSAFRLHFGPKSVRRILHMPREQLAQGDEAEVRQILTRSAEDHNLTEALMPFAIAELARALPELVDPLHGEEDSEKLEQPEELRGAFRSRTAEAAEDAKPVSGAPLTVPSREKLEGELKKRVKGQDLVAEQVASQLTMTFRGLKGPSPRPKGVFLFAGPTGVGKTEMAKAIADSVYGPGENLIRLDMSEYRERHSAARLIGPPPGYVGHTDPAGWLTTKVIANPRCVLLLDEFEKADESVWQTFLQVFEDGRLTDGRGKTADFSEVVVVLTSNIGSRAAAAKPTGFGQALAEGSGEGARISSQVMQAVRRELPPELFNRIDGVFAFSPLDEKLLVEIARAKLKIVKAELAEVGYELTFTGAVARAIASFEPEPALGARPVIRAIDRLVREPLVDLEPGKYKVRAPKSTIRFIVAPSQPAQP